jgi:hypothetical protein
VSAGRQPELLKKQQNEQQKDLGETWLTPCVRTFLPIFPGFRFRSRKFPGFSFNTCTTN